MKLSVQPAPLSDHWRVVEIARQSRYTRSFSSLWFSGPEAYSRGWVVGAYLIPAYNTPRLVGFYCCRVKKREPVTNLYFLGVRGGFRGLGVGTELMNYLEAQARARGHRVSLLCNEDNAEALKFYTARHYVIVDRVPERHAVRMVKEL